MTEDFMEKLEKMCDTWDMESIFHSYADGKADYVPAAGAVTTQVTPAPGRNRYIFDTDSV